MKTYFDEAELRAWLRSQMDGDAYWEALKRNERIARIDRCITVVSLLSVGAFVFGHWVIGLGLLGAAIVGVIWRGDDE